ncbi:MAG: outer membrane protein assembly factor BamE [Pseudomonadota bacterium]
MQKIYNSLAVLSLIFIITACANTVNRGHLKEDQVISNIKPGLTSKSEVLKMFGSPSSESTFGTPTWYYISTIKENRSILASKIVDQNVIEITLDSNGTVSEVKQYSFADKKDVEIAIADCPEEAITAS